MAQPIIAQVTLSQLNTLIAGSATTWNNNYWGTQFYVTDKGWLLHAHKDNICKPVDGKLTIMNGDTLPTGIEPDILMVDTGVITISSEIGGAIETPTEITIPSGYYLGEDCGLKIISSPDVCALYIANNYDEPVFEFNERGDISVGEYIGEPATYTFFRNSSHVSGNYKIVGNVPAGTTTLKSIIEFHKSPFA